MKRGRHGSHGKGQQGTARVGNSLTGDLLKTNKRNMPQDAPLQAQATPGVTVGTVGNKERMRIPQQPYYPKGLA